MTRKERHDQLKVMWQHLPIRLAEDPKFLSWQGRVFALLGYNLSLQSQFHKLATSIIDGSYRESLSIENEERATDGLLAIMSQAINELDIGEPDDRRSTGEQSASSSAKQHPVDYILLAVGVALILLPLVFVVGFSQSVDVAGLYLRIIASLGGALVGASLPGLLEISFPGVRAVGAFAVLVLFWQTNPPAVLNRAIRPLELDPQSFRYVDWDSRPCEMKKLEGQNFIVSCSSETARTVQTLKYLTWDGTRWEAMFDGRFFVHAPQGDWARQHIDDHLNYLTSEKLPRQVRISAGGK